MNFEQLLISLCMLLVGVLCTVGVFHSSYNDTLLERIGMSTLAVWMFLRFASTLSLSSPEECFSRPVAIVLLYGGMACYATGAAWAKYKAACRRRPPRPPTPPTGPGELDHPFEPGLLR